jgi:hypothetical protein
MGLKDVVGDQRYVRWTAEPASYIRVGLFRTQSDEASKGWAYADVFPTPTIRHGANISRKVRNTSRTVCESNWPSDLSKRSASTVRS